MAFAVPESERPARDRLRERLVELGAVALQGGLYVSADDIDAHLRPSIAELGIARYVAHLSTPDLDVGGVTDPARIAAGLRDLAATQDAWQRFVDDLDRRLVDARRGVPARADELSLLTGLGPVLGADRPAGRPSGR